MVSNTDTSGLSKQAKIFGYRRVIFSP